MASSDVVPLADGGRLAYRRSGAGRPLVLVHGWAVGSAGFDRQVREPLSGAEVFAPDLRGHGRSSHEAEAMTISALAQDLVAFFDALDLRGAVAVGWSMGALVLWRALQEGLGARVAGLVVVDMTPKVINDEAWRLGLKGGHDRAATERTVEAIHKNWPSFCKLFVPRILADGAGEAARARAAPLVDVAAANPPDAMAALWRSLSAEDARARLPKVGAPTLVVHGEKSQLYGEETARFIADETPDARLFPFRNSGHAPHLEEPEAFDAALSAFAAEIGQPFRPTAEISPRAARHQEIKGETS